MSVVRHWRRSALGASGVALLLPLGLAIGVALTAALGGQASLRALGQVFQGPAAPPSRSAPGLEATRDVPAVPVRSRAGGVPAGAAVPGDRRSRRSGGEGAGGRPVPGGPGGTPPAAAAPGSGEPAAGGPAPSPGAAPGPAPSALRRTGQAVADRVSRLPDPAGTGAGDATQSVVDLIP